MKRDGLSPTRVLGWGAWVVESPHRRMSRNWHFAALGLTEMYHAILIACSKFLASSCSRDVFQKAHEKVIYACFKPSKKATSRFLIITPIKRPVPSSVIIRYRKPSFPNSSTAYSSGAVAETVRGVLSTK